MTGDPVRWGFLAAGFIATTALAPAVHASSKAKLQAVAASEAHRAERLEPARVYTDYRQVLDAPDVDAVYISLTNDQHLPWILAALKAGKPVLCEKPLTLNAAECREAFATAEDLGIPLVEATWMRWHPRHRRAGQLLEGAAGPVRRITATFTFDGVPRANYRLDSALGGGALLDLGPYVLAPLVDWAREPITVIRSAAEHNDTGADLRTTATLEGANCSSSITTSIVDPEQQALQVETDSRSLTWEEQPFSSWHAPCSLVITENNETRAEAFPPCDAYRLMVDAVSAHIRGDQAAYVPDASCSIRTAELIDAIRLEAAKGVTTP